MFILTSTEHIVAEQPPYFLIILPTIKLFIQMYETVQWEWVSWFNSTVQSVNEQNHTCASTYLYFNKYNQKLFSQLNIVLRLKLRRTM